MKSADKVRLYGLLDEMKEVLANAKTLNKKDVYMMCNELIIMKLQLEEKSKALNKNWGEYSPK